MGREKRHTDEEKLGCAVAQNRGAPGLRLLIQRLGLVFRFLLREGGDGTVDGTGLDEERLVVLRLSFLMQSQTQTVLRSLGLVAAPDGAFRGFIGGCLVGGRSPSLLLTALELPLGLGGQTLEIVGKIFLGVVLILCYGDTTASFRITYGV